MDSLKKLLDERWSVRVGKQRDGGYYADAVLCDEDGIEDWDRFVMATDLESPENALKILEAKASDLVISLN